MDNFKKMCILNFVTLIFVIGNRLSEEQRNSYGVNQKNVNICCAVESSTVAFVSE
jgi:hypothetical protein